MPKCDVCGKTSLLPEKIGNVHICKLCYLKANGPFWNRQYDKKEEAEKQRCKALEAAHQQHFPQPVIMAINGFFMDQINAAQICDCCGQAVQYRQSIGNANICRSCFGKINTPAWRQTDYLDNDAVEENRNRILKIATQNHFPAIVIDSINQHFDSKLQPGLLFYLEGVPGQTLKVFTDHCLLFTDQDDFDKKEIAVAFTNALGNGKPEEGFFSDEIKKTIIRSVISGGIVKTGMKLATSAVINSAVGKSNPKTEKFRIIPGEYKIDFHLYEYAEYQKTGENDIGFIRFFNIRSKSPQSDVIFFFDTDTEKLTRAYKEICNRMEKISNPILTNTVEQQPSKQEISAADEILKYKNLLDIGAITQEEYDAKKKELLKL